MKNQKTQFIIRHAKPKDLGRMLEIYAYAREFMATHGNPLQWGPTNWPPEELLREDIATGRGYVCEVIDNGTDGAAEDTWAAENSAEHAGAQESQAAGTATANPRIVGAFCYLFGKDIEPTYAVIEDGAWLDDSPYGVVHRLAGDGSVRGIGAACINWVYEQCGHVRVDTHTDNVVLQGLLEKLGYTRCGIIHIVEDNYPRIAYEKSAACKKQPL